MILRHSGGIELRGPASPAGLRPERLQFLPVGKVPVRNTRTDDSGPAIAFVNPAYPGGCAVTGLRYQCVGLAEDDDGRELVVAHTYGTPARNCLPAT
jgi:hypothetical protein